MAAVSEALAAAIAHHQAGRLPEAEQVYRQILAVEPNHADAWHLLGVAAHQTGRRELAVQYIGRALELEPNFAEAHSNLGIAFQEQGMLDQAIACHRRALALKPNYAAACSNLANALQVAGDLDDAIACYRQAVERMPDVAEVHYNLGTALSAQNKLNEAVACYHQALALSPDDAAAHNNLANALKGLEKPGAALDHYRRALEINPALAEAHNNLGNILREQGEIDEAVTHCRRAVELRPDYAEAHRNLGTACNDRGELDQAAKCFRRALELKPDDAETHRNLSFLLLRQGNFDSGWREYEWRWKTGQLPRRDFVQPRWDGTPLQERSILLHAEQGLGDTIQFIRYAPLVKALGATVFVECPKGLTTLIASCPGVDRLFAGGDELPPFDVHAPLVSLPGILKTSLDTIPGSVPYLFADAALAAHWRERLAGGPAFQIGIHWRGRGGQGSFRRRDIPLKLFSTLAQLPGVRLVNLQKGVKQQELSVVQSPVPMFDPGQDLDTSSGAFMDTAAIMVNLDLIITSDTSIPHLAGALGVPVWLALPFASDWRWLLGRSDSPWYPTMRLFRQKSPGDWKGVFEEIQKAVDATLVRRPATHR